MRVLIGHIDNIPQLQQHAPLPTREDRNDDIRAYGRIHPQIRYEPGMSWPQLLANCPPGWRPDVYIHRSPEYNAVPLGLEQADCLTVGVFGDWNLGGQMIHSVAGMFDVLVADRNGGDVLRRAGYDNVLYARLWAYDPELHKREEEVVADARDLDIVMIGSMNHAVQARRARWLARVARLSTRYKIVFAYGMHGEEYARMLNRAKIVFNCSVRGEINMRAYEAPACGALLFNEADNAEIRDIYTDRVDCVLYTEDNLEALLDYYLHPSHAAERKAIARAGWERVQPHTYARHLADLITMLEPMAAEYAENRTEVRSRRTYVRLPSRERSLRLATHWMLSAERRIYPQVEQLLVRVEMEQGRHRQTPSIEQAEIINMRAVLAGEWALARTAAHQREATLKAARIQAERAYKLAPDYVIAGHNLAHMQLESGLYLAAEAALRDTLRRLEEQPACADSLMGVLFPRKFGYFDVAQERIRNTYRHGSPEWTAAIRSLLIAQIRLDLALIAYRREDWISAEEHARQALSLAPDMDEAELTRAWALRAQGRVEQSIASYRHALQLMPFLVPAWEELAQLCIDTGRNDEAIELLDDWLAITAAFPMYASLRPALEQIREQASRQALAGANLTPPIMRLLACPDWNVPEDWQRPIRAFAAAYRPQDRAVLMMRADPKQVPRTEDLLLALQSFLLDRVGLAASALPNITQLNQPLDPADRWKLVHVSDALVAAHEPPAVWRQLAEAAGKPIYTADDLRSGVPISLVS